MNIWNRIFGRKGGNGPTELLNAVRAAIRDPGDDCERLAALLAKLPPLNTIRIEPDRPITIGPMGVMFFGPNAHPAILAAMLHKPQRLRCLLRSGASPDIRCTFGRTPLHWAIVGEADYAIAAGAEASQSILGKHGGGLPASLLLPPIGADLQAASLAATRVLLDEGANPNSQDGEGHTPLHRATLVAGKAAHVEVLLAAGAKVDLPAPSGFTPLMLAVRNCNEEIVRILLRAGADPFLQDKSGQTPLATAVANKSYETALILLEHMGTDLPLARLPGLSPLIVAAQQGDDRMIEMLLRHHPNLEAATRDGWTALHEAVPHGAALSQMLLDAGANPNATTRGWYTPLHRAAAKAMLEVFQLLLDRGADPTARDLGFASVVDFANSSGNPAMVERAQSAYQSAKARSEESGIQEFMAWEEKVVATAPQRLDALEAAHNGSCTSGDGRTPSSPVNLNVTDFATAALAIYRHLDAKHGRRSPSDDPAAKSRLPARGWRPQEASLVEHNGRLLTRMDFLVAMIGPCTAYFDTSAYAARNFLFLSATMKAHAKFSAMTDTGLR